MILDELLVALGFDYDDKELSKFKKDVGESINLAKGLIKSMVAGAVAITGLVTATTAASDEQGKFAAEIGATVEEVDALQYAMELSGGSAESMSNSLRQLSIRASEAARGVGSGVEAFGLLGLSSSDANGNLKSASQLMMEISGAFSGLDKSRQIELADKLGVKDSIRLLQQGPSAIRNMITEAEALGITTAKDAAISAEYQDSLTALWKIIKDISRTITRVFAPIMIEFNKSIIQWWKNNKAIIEQNLPSIIEKITFAFKLLSGAVVAFIGIKILGHLAALLTLLRGVTIATLAAGAAAFLLPIAIGAAIAAIGLLAEDAKVFYEGGESFIGDMLTKYPQWASEIETIATIFNAIAQATIMIFEGWKNIIDLFSSTTMQDFKDFFKNIPGFLGDITGLYNTDGTGTIPDAINKTSTAANTFIDKMEIIVQGGMESAQSIANEVYNVFQQTSQELNSTVDQ